MKNEDGEIDYLPIQNTKNTKASSSVTLVLGPMPWSYALCP